MPVEIYHLWHRFTWLRVAVLVANLAVVACMVYALRHRAAQERELADKSMPV